jgi:hypothetical protein
MVSGIDTGAAYEHLARTICSAFQIYVYKPLSFHPMRIDVF